jgi:hypothetical protein
VHARTSCWLPKTFGFFGVVFFCWPFFFCSPPSDSFLQQPPPPLTCCCQSQPLSSAAAYAYWDPLQHSTRIAHLNAWQESLRRRPPVRTGSRLGFLDFKRKKENTLFSHPRSEQRSIPLLHHHHHLECCIAPSRQGRRAPWTEAGPGCTRLASI